jgi:hypothetical protein
LTVTMHYVRLLILLACVVGVEAKDNSCASFMTQPANGFSASWVAPETASSNSFGAIVIRLTKSGKEHKLPLTAVPSGGPLRLQNASCSAAGTQVNMNLAFQSGSHAEGLSLTLSSARDGFTVNVVGSQLAVNFLSVAAWPSELTPRAVAIPYYSFPIVWLPTLGVFSNVYWDWTVSQATILNSSRAEYRALTDGRRNDLREKLIVKLAPNLDDVLPDIPNPKSTYFSTVAGRMVLDIWGPPFSTIASTLAILQRAGLKDCIALIHTWQHDGYDNGLPEHYPASTALGGEVALSQAVEAGRAAGCLVGLHENYVDYYPDYPRFDPKAVALDVKGQLQKAWFNSSVPIQSYAARPNLYVTNAATQSPEIHRLYRTSASFIDVNSSTFPWWRADLDATAPGAGMFSTYEKASADLWEFERRSHGGPVFGEGKEHWFWTGMLDGVEAQLGSEDIKVDKPAYPLFVDFDLLKIHSLQVNHGMGYYNRWLPEGQTIQKNELLDAYRMQEIAYGHAPFVGTELWNNIPQVLIEQNLIGPVAKRYGAATAKVIRYEVNGAWTGTNAAVAARDWSRVEVTYSNGDSIVANARPKTLLWQGLSIPQNGWAAKGPGLLAYTAINAGHIVDYAETPNSYFANARNQNDLERAGVAAEPKVISFKQTAGRSAEIQVAWNVIDPPTVENLTNFVHFVGSDGSIAFGADHAFAAPTSTWVAGQTVNDTFGIAVPPTVVDGTYSLRVGLYAPGTGVRTALLGRNDGTTRYTVGNLTVSGGGTRVAFEPAAALPLIDNPRLNATGAMVDFGAIKTDGMVSLVRSDAGWIVRAYPNSRNVAVSFNSRILPPPEAIVCDAGPTREQLPQVSGGYWSIQTVGSSYCSW